MTNNDANQKPYGVSMNTKDKSCKTAEEISDQFSCGEGISVDHMAAIISKHFHEPSVPVSDLEKLAERWESWS